MKVGDVVEIVNTNAISNIFEIGEFVTITYVEYNEYGGIFKYKSYDKKGNEWWLQDKNIK